MSTILVADIGGTNARFAIAAGAPPTLLARHEEPTGEISDLASALAAFLDRSGVARPQRAVVAVAAPIGGDAVALTNARLRFSISGMQKRLGLDALSVVNDFEAMARGADASRRTAPVKDGQAIAAAPRIVLGPGTGLGLSILIGEGAALRIFPTQGGHCAFAPQTDEEWTVWRAAMAQDGYVSFENIVSGSGLVRIHAALNAASAQDLSPRDLTKAALAGERAALRTFHVFLSALGTFAADAALATGARGGVVLAGGILPRIETLLAQGAFAERFVARPAMRAYLEAIPVRLLLDPDAALIGAALIGAALIGAAMSL